MADKTIEERLDQEDEDLRELQDQVPCDEERWYFDANKKNWRAIDKQISAPVEIDYTFSNASED
jgi:hypothetical protein